jgi:ParB family chromosome partitioning protein
LVENIQREDLNPIEVAYALNRMLQEFHLSHEELAGRTGKDRTTITNLLRLLKLPGDIRELVADRAISMGHARALLSIDDPDEQRRLAKRVVDQDLSARQVERLVQQDSAAGKKHATQPPIDPNVVAAIESLERALGTRVRLVPRGANKGRIEIEYNSAEDLDRIYSAIIE